MPSACQLGQSTPIAAGQKALGHFARSLLATLTALGAITRPSAVAAQPFVDVTSVLSDAPAQGPQPESDDICMDPVPDCYAPYTGAAAVGDYDGDGDPDIFYTRFGPSDLLYENQGNGTFEEVGALVGLAGDAYSNGAAFVDVDNDGDLDLFVARATTGAHALFVNRGSSGSASRPVFEEQAAARGVAFGSAPGAPVIGGSVAVGDYDRDGWADLYLTEWVFALSECGTEHSRLLRNRGSVAPGTFEDVTRQAGLTISSRERPESWTFAAAFRDLDDDGFQDLAIAGDFETSRLFWNNGDGTFTDGTRAAGVGTDKSGMGSTFADYDRDGDLDWFVSAIQSFGPPFEPFGNRLYRNDGARQFTDVTTVAGVRNTGWPWGSAFFDADHDGDHDLAVVNGMRSFVNDQPDNRFFEQGGSASGVFADISEAAGFTDEGIARGIVTLDYDMDGDSDVFIVRVADTPLLLRNDGGAARGDWLRVYVEGRAGTSDGYGARVELVPSAGPHSSMVESVDSTTQYLGQSERVAHFGLGAGFATAGGTASVTVTFLGGHVVTLEDVEPNQRIVVIEPDDTAPRPAADRQTGGCSAAGTCARDCDGNGSADACELLGNPELDCNGNVVIDICEIAVGTASDCNANAQIDDCELAANPTLDCDRNGSPDDCELSQATDRNTNGVLDACEDVDAGPETSDQGPTLRSSGGACSATPAGKPWLLATVVIALASLCSRRGRTV